MAIDMFETRTMLSVLEQLYPARTFLRDTFFRNVRTFDTNKVDIDIVQGKRRIGAYVGPKGESHISDRNGFTVLTYEPVDVSEKRPIKPEDLRVRLPGEVIYSSSETPMTRQARLISEDLSELDDMITRREEQQASSALFNGSITFRNSNEKVTFPIRDSHKITSMTNYWDQDGGTPIDDLRDWRQLIAQHSGLSADIVIGGSAAIRAMINNPQIDSEKGGALSDVKIIRGEITPQNLPGGVTYWGLMPEVGADIYSYDEWYYDEDSETEVPMVPVNKILIGCTQARMDRLYGLVDSVEIAGAVARFPDSWVEHEPSVRYLKLSSKPLLVPHQVDSFITATVIKPS